MTFSTIICHLHKDTTGKAVMLGEATIEGLSIHAPHGRGEILIEPDRLASAGTPLFTGVMPTTLPLINEAKRLRRPYIAIDNGYFKPYQRGGYFRATTNALQWTRAPIDVEPDRFLAVGPQIKPWRKSGSHILVCLQSPLWFELFAGDRDAWVDSITAELRRFTDRPIRIRANPLRSDWKKIDAGVAPSLLDDLVDCWAAVALSSNSLVEAVLAGIPVIPLGRCAVSYLATPISLVENPRMPDDREAWAWTLAANQWTLEEMKSGKMLSELEARYQPDFDDLA